MVPLTGRRESVNGSLSGQIISLLTAAAFFSPHQAGLLMDILHKGERRIFFFTIAMAIFYCLFSSAPRLVKQRCSVPERKRIIGSYMQSLNALECCLVLVWLYLIGKSFSFVNFPSRHRFRSSLNTYSSPCPLWICWLSGMLRVCVMNVVILQSASYRNNLLRNHQTGN